MSVLGKGKTNMG